MKSVPPGWSVRSHGRRQPAIRRVFFSMEVIRSVLKFMKEPWMSSGARSGGGSTTKQDRGTSDTKGRRVRKNRFSEDSAFDDPTSISTPGGADTDPVVHAGEVLSWSTESAKRRFHTAEGLIWMVALTIWAAFVYEAALGRPDAGSKLFERAWPIATAAVTWMYGSRMARFAAKAISVAAAEGDNVEARKTSGSVRFRARGP